jgi:hypothetical protein
MNNLKLTKIEFESLVCDIEGIIANQFAEIGKNYASYPLSAIDEDVKKVLQKNKINLKIED